MRLAALLVACYLASGVALVAWGGLSLAGFLVGVVALFASAALTYWATA